MNRRKLLIAFAAMAVLLAVLAPEAMARAGGGSSGFSGGGGGGSGVHGKGVALYIIFRLLLDIALIGHGLGFLFLIGLVLLYFFVTRWLPAMQANWAERTAGRGGGHKKTSERERRVELAAAEAADENPEFDPDHVRSTARNLFFEIQKAWDSEDRVHLRGLVASDLLA
ncbi:MAG: hypothetical protein ACRDNK_01015, partial [Solirubrobacteraceae bacterium]